MEKITVQSAIGIFIVVVGFLFLFLSSDNETKSQVSNFIMLVIGYYFGSSRSTAKKDETIAEQLNQK